MPSSHGGSHRFESYSAHHSPIFGLRRHFGLVRGQAGKFLVARQLIRGNIAESSKGCTFCAEADAPGLRRLITKKISREKQFQPDHPNSAALI